MEVSEVLEVPEVSVEVWHMRARYATNGAVSYAMPTNGVAYAYSIRSLTAGSLRMPASRMSFSAASSALAGAGCVSMTTGT